MICDVGLLYMWSHYLFMCMLKFLYAYFGGSLAEEADKISILKKNLMLIGYVHQFT
jgi:hypothetical protein